MAPSISRIRNATRMSNSGKNLSPPQINVNGDTRQACRTDGYPAAIRESVRNRAKWSAENGQVRCVMARRRPGALRFRHARLSDAARQLAKVVPAERGHHGAGRCPIAWRAEDRGGEHSPGPNARHHSPGITGQAQRVAQAARPDSCDSRRYILFPAGGQNGNPSNMSQ